MPFRQNAFGEKIAQPGTEYAEIDMTVLDQHGLIGTEIWSADVYPDADESYQFGGTLFISADEDWMDAVEKHGDVVAGTRDTFLGNRLVLVASTSRTTPVAIRPNSAFARTLASGPIAMADVGSVPAGKYGKASLEHMGLWAAAEPHVVQAENVRAALALVERGAAPLGIVYSTDARASRKVKIVGVFPEASHPPIRYPIARLRASTSPDAEGFRRFLISAAGKAIFAKYGFSPL